MNALDKPSTLFAGAHSLAPRSGSPPVPRHASSSSADFALDFQSSAPLGQAGFSLQRFPDEVDPSFLCSVCQQFARQPQECRSCSAMVCAGCTNSACPLGCGPLAPASQFALMFYNRHRVRCQYWLNGCDFLEAIPHIDEHEIICECKPVKCRNPVCSRQVAGDPVCSDACQVILEYARCLEVMSKTERMQQFYKLMLATRKLLSEEVRSELAAECSAIEEVKQEVEKFLVKRERLNIQLFRLKNYYHPGEWTLQVWDCCSQTQRLAQGCKQLPNVTKAPLRYATRALAARKLTAPAPAEPPAELCELCGSLSYA